MRATSAVSVASDEGLPLTQQQAPRLSRMSCSTKNAVALNQLHRVEIRSCYARAKDNAVVYVLDVVLKPYQTGIPNVRMSAEFIDEHSTHRGELRTATTTTDSTDNMSPQYTSAQQQEQPRSSHADCAESKADPATTPSSESKKHASASKPPRYQIEHRYSAFRELRKRLREAVEESDRHHVKWCWYCSKMQWLTMFGSFPSRHPLLRLLATYSHCGESLERAVLSKALRRRRKLECFVNEVVANAKDASYRYRPGQCDGFVKVSSIVTDFLAEPIFGVNERE